jgi:hypothetical protein
MSTLPRRLLNSGYSVCLSLSTRTVLLLLWMPKLVQVMNLNGDHLWFGRSFVVDAVHSTMAGGLQYLLMQFRRIAALVDAVPEDCSTCWCSSGGLQHLLMQFRRMQHLLMQFFKRRPEDPMRSPPTTAFRSHGEGDCLFYHSRYNRLRFP